MLEFQHEDKLKDWLMSNSNCGRTEHREQNIILKKKEEIIDKRRLIASLSKKAVVVVLIDDKKIKIKMDKNIKL